MKVRGFMVTAHMTNPPPLQDGDGINAYGDWQEFYKSHVDPNEVRDTARFWEKTGYDDVRVLTLVAVEDMAITNQGSVVFAITMIEKMHGALAYRRHVDALVPLLASEGRRQLYDRLRPLGTKEGS